MASRFGNYNYGGYPQYGYAPQYGQQYPGYGQPIPQFAPPQTPQDSGQKPVLQVPWVNGDVGAQAYLVPPNSATILMDSDRPIFYIKTSDASGRASIQAFKYEEIKAETAPPAPQGVGYVTKEEFEAFKASLSQVKTESKEE